MTKTLYLDHDVNYKSYFSSQKYEAFKMWFPKITNVYGPAKIQIRESPNEKVHLKLDFDVDIELFDTMIIRALLADDAYRLIMDLKRCFTVPDETNRIFDEKWSDGQMKKAGEWKDLPVIL